MQARLFVVVVDLVQSKLCFDETMSRAERVTEGPPDGGWEEFLVILSYPDLKDEILKENS